MPALLLQADDNAISKAVTLGIAESIDYGLVRNTGLFMNTPWSKLALETLAPDADVCVGIDVNLVTGVPLSPAGEIPAFTSRSGAFLKSGEVMARGEIVGQDGFIVRFAEDPYPLDQVRLEVGAQIENFRHLAGRKPDYLHFHSLATPNIDLVVREFSESLGIPTSTDLSESSGVELLPNAWYTRPFPIEAQAAMDPLPHLLEALGTLDDNATGVAITHPGYVDAEVLDLSTFSVIRARDLQMLTSDELRAQLEARGFELTTYRDVLS